jgi:hypothetical protein
MGVLATGSTHARPSAWPTINISNKKVDAHVCKLGFFGILMFCESEAHDNFHDPRTTPTGILFIGGREKERKKYQK